MRKIIVRLMTISLLNSLFFSSFATDNPLLKPFKTPYGVPPFEQIKVSDFKPAFDEGMRQQKEEIDKLVKQKDLPTFENTIVAYEKTGSLLEQVNSIFDNLNSANTSEEMQKLAKEMAPVLSKHYDDILMNGQLFDRIYKVFMGRGKIELTPEQSMLLEKTYKHFVRAGALLNDSKKARLRELNEQLSVLSLQFGQNLLAETNAFKLVIDDKADLAGLPQSLIDAAAEKAKKSGMDGKWVFTLQNPSVMPFLQYSEKRELRHKIWEAYQNRSNNNNANDNKALIVKIIQLRTERSQLLGYATYANYVLDENMAKVPSNVYQLLYKLWNPALKVAKREAADMQQMINAEGNTFQLEAYDWRYYAEKVRKARYDLNEENIKPYFKLDNVRDGAFETLHKLYGLSFKLDNSLPKYQPDVQGYVVKDVKGKLIGILYMDFYPRASKRGGAWMTSYRKEKIEKGKRTAPVISVVYNFTTPTAATPALLTYDEVTTLFHELGHAVHGLLSQCTYETLSGTSVARDFVEMLSQINENWATEPEVLRTYAKHYQTGSVIPDALIQKLSNSSHFNQGFATVEYLAACFLDMDLHTVKDTNKIDVLAFEKKSMDDIHLINSIIPRYRTTYYNHIWSSGYAAGYYSYIWAEVLDADAFSVFKKNGIFDPKTADSFRTNILECGGSKDPMLLFRNFRGSDPDIMPLLERRGLKE
jgi:peptidyl-dipeptidase Dcp